MSTPRAVSADPVLGYPRADGRVGIRNVVAVVHLGEGARAVADAIAAGQPDVHVIGFSGGHPSAHARRMLEALCTHPNVGAVVLVSPGREDDDRERLAGSVAASGRPVTTLVIHQLGGTRATVTRGRVWVEEVRSGSVAARTVPVRLTDLVVGTICGGPDATTGITANPVVGRVLDRLVAAGGTAVFEGTGELIGCEEHMAGRAVTAELGREIVARVREAMRYRAASGHAGFSPGNAGGGLTTLEEKSLGVYSQSGSGPIHGVVPPGHPIPAPGLYVLAAVPEGVRRRGDFPDSDDDAEISGLVAAGAHVVLLTTGRGSAVGPAVSPVVKICANPVTFRRMSDDMDVDAGRILAGRDGIDHVADEVLSVLYAVAAGRPTASEGRDHRELMLTSESG